MLVLALERRLAGGKPETMDHSARCRAPLSYHHTAGHRAFRLGVGTERFRARASLYQCGNQLDIRLMVVGTREPRNYQLVRTPYPSRHLRAREGEKLGSRGCPADHTQLVSTPKAQWSTGMDFGAHVP